MKVISVLYKTIVFACDDPSCKKRIHVQEFVTFELARKAGWAIARDRQHCYCPDCAPKHRNVGRLPTYGGYASWRKK